MTDPPKTPDYHEDERQFREALRAVAARTGFATRLIEKDYYCSLALRALAAAFEQGLVFKGGTSLSKVHAEFFRLSEDLDFALSISPSVRRSARRAAVEPFKTHVDQIAKALPCFRAAVALTGFNDSRQYNGELGYRSAVTGEEERVKIEIALREEALLPPETLPARTLLSDPATGAPVISHIPVRALSLRETYAEKIRAALTRREPAIRDFFDIDNAVASTRLAHSDRDLAALVNRKLEVAVASGEPVALTPERIKLLRGQVETQLRPVLREADYAGFDLDRVVGILKLILALCQE
ncbi:MAG: nucleotidyl transferase AbiEii/AbiGii toxin family protein [Gemmataceae bacterium]